MSKGFQFYITVMLFLVWGMCLVAMSRTNYIMDQQETIKAYIKQVLVDMPTKKEPTDDRD